MTSLACLKNTETSILYSMPAGKPNPSKPCPLENDKRDRVMQLAYKGNTCWYYVLNYIRMRIGKNPCAELKLAREIEARCSAHRKAITKHELSLPAIADQLSTERGKKMLEEIDQNTANFFKNNWKMIAPTIETPEALEGCPSLLPSLEEFLKRNKEKNMYEFFLWKKFTLRIELHTKFLQSFDVDPQKEFEAEITKKNGYDPKRYQWKTLDLTEKAALLDFFTRKLSAEKYGLTKSKWTPLSGIDGLISELKEHGPLSIGGIFGHTAYVDKPFKTSQTIASREIYGWKPGAQRQELTVAGHSVLLIGAEKVQDKAYVYFIDPIDTSNPKDISKQRIFKISFANLESSICDLHGRLTLDSPEAVGYAYHGNFKSLPNERE